MKIPQNVKPMPFLFGLIYKGYAFRNSVYLRKSILDDIGRETPNPLNVGILLHELEHVKRMRRQGYWRHSLKYWTSAQFRLKEELAANKPEMQYVKKSGASYDISKRAKHLSGPIYIWCVSYETAKSELEALWNKL